MSVLLAVFTLHAVTQFGGATVDDVFARWVNAVICVAPGLFVLGRALRVRRERGPWLLIGAGLLLWGIGNVYYLFFLSDPIPIPSAADAMWITFYLLSYAGLVLLMRARIASVRASAWSRRPDRRVGDRGARHSGRLRHRARRRRRLEARGRHEPHLPARRLHVDRARRRRPRRQRVVRGSRLGAHRVRLCRVRGLGQLLPLPVGDRLVRAGAVVDVGWPLGMLLVAYAAGVHRRPPPGFGSRASPRSSCRCCSGSARSRCSSSTTSSA